MKQMKERLPQKELAATAAKRKTEKSEKSPKGVTTRATARLTSSDATVKGFTLANLKKAKAKNEVLFQLQEGIATFAGAFERLGYSMEQKALCVAFMLKEWQREGIYCSCDSLIYHRAGNVVRMIEPNLHTLKFI